MSVEFTGSKAKLSWIYDVPDGNYTRVIIEQYNETGECLERDVTDSTQQILEVSVLGGDKFYMVIYQDGFEAYRSEDFAQKPESTIQSSEWHKMFC